MDWSFWQNFSNVLILVGALFGGILVSIGTFGHYYCGKKIGQKDATQHAQSGVLEPASKVLFSADTETYPKMEFGDSGAVFVFAGKPGTPLLKFAEGSALTIEVENDQIKISILIRDKSGTVVAELIKNEWKVNRNHSWDRNYSKNALEVKDDTGDIVLQIRLVVDKVQLQAKVYDSTGRGVGIGKVLGLDGWGGEIELTGPNHPELLLKIDPIFKYPSDSHLGELADE